MIDYNGQIYTYWPKSGKWRARGSAPVYKSRDIHQFFIKYVFKYEDEKKVIAFDQTINRF